MIALLLALQQNLIVDPLLVVEAQEVWSVIGRPNNPVWPGWDARKTPILIYFPGKQELLINHPKPPAGFVPYAGPVKSTLGPMYIHDGPTIMQGDGQNTSTEINGVGTLVVADTLSTRRQWVEGLVPAITANPDKASDTIESALFRDPYDEMTVFAHEAFHVYQGLRAPNKRGVELALTRYPALSVENNTGFALESDLLAAALAATDPAQVRQDAIQWLAVRDWRRGIIGKEGADYEDGTEFSEGTAKYVQYRMLQSLEGRTPQPEMWLLQGFQGYANLAHERELLIQQMQAFMSGKATVNNDLYGASPVRWRLYYSGMAIGALLDKLGAQWHEPLLATGASLTDLARQALHPSPAELDAALAQVKATPRYAELFAQKQKLAQDGAAYIQNAVDDFEKAPGELIIDFSALAKPTVRILFTPFGILRIDDQRRLYRLIPARGKIDDLTFAEQSPRPVLEDSGAKQIHLQLTAPPDPNLNSKTLATEPLTLPGVALQKVKGTLEIKGTKAILHLAN